MRVAIVGTGYVGLTTGVVLAYIGHEVTCVDVDEAKIRRLQAGEVPIYEPGLAELLAVVNERIRFTQRYDNGVPEADVVFIAVGTPGLANGDPDLRFLREAAQSIGRHLGPEPTVVVTKSTVPIGSGNWVESLVQEASESVGSARPFAVASNPEFLREGAALRDSFYADRIVVGADHRGAVEVLERLYLPILEQSFVPPTFLPRPEGYGSVPLLRMDLISAELVKYAANAFLPLKISFINEIAALSERIGADIAHVAKGIGLDSRIGSRFLQAGVGWGGSCFGKDTAALIATAREYGLKMPIVEAAREVNRRQRDAVVESIQRELKILKGRTITLLGLAFKPNTDDLRDSPAVEIARNLVTRGARVQVYDPVAVQRAKHELRDLDLIYCEQVNAAVRHSDAVVLVTDWPEYGSLDWRHILELVRTPILIDCRNMLDRETLRGLGFKYIGVGYGERPVANIGTAWADETIAVRHAAAAKERR